MHHNSTILKHICYSLLIGATLMLQDILLAKTKVQLDIGGISGSSCEGYAKDAVSAGSLSQGVFVAGSLAQISVTLLPDPRPQKLPFQGFPETQPSWLKIEVGYAPDESGSFVPSQNLFDLISPTYILDESQTRTNKVWKERVDLKEISKLPTYFFLIHVPEELAGKKVCARVLITDPPYGPLVEDKYGDPFLKAVDCMQIVAPCSQEDIGRALASQISYTKSSGNYKRTIQIADSIIDAGWRVGLIDAESAALRLERYKDALRYLDLRYEAFGIVTPKIGGETSEKFSPEEAQEYQRQRENLLQKIAEQEQQQH